MTTSATHAPDAPVAPRRGRHARWIAALALVVALVPLVSGGPAHGDPIDDKRAQATALQAEIDANGARIGELSEQYNGAQYRLEQAQAAIAEAEQKLEATRVEVDRLRALVNERGAALYRGLGQGSPISLDVTSANSLIASSKYSTLAAEHDTKLLDELRRAERSLRDQRAQAEQAQVDAEDEQREIAKARAGVETANARQEQLLSQVNGEIAQLVAEERARKEAAELAAAQARYAAVAAATATTTTTTTTTTNGTPSTAAPSSGRGSATAGGGGSAPAPTASAPVSGGAGAAIAYARAQLGKPYCYAGAGPSCFDCSGLTMRAWGAAGVSMPHYSGAQYSKFPKVPLGAMQPGDLVFWGPGGSQHVGLYIGGGQMIAAPHTGDVVKIQAVYGSPVGAVRPG